MQNKKSTKPRMQDQVRAKLMGRLLDAGYSDVTDFWRQTGIGVSHETVRRTLHGGKPTSVETVIKIGAHLGLTNAELADLCRSMGDTFWAKRLWDPKTNKRDEAVLNIINRIAAANTKYWSFFVVNAQVCAQAAGVDISAYLEILRQIIESEEPESDFQDLEVRKM